ncbi:protein of unknown function [Rhodovastum atsumiense]|nr:protein of unknown function [Rhodovastum atsumiense]
MPAPAHKGPAASRFRRWEPPSSKWGCMLRTVLPDALSRTLQWGKSGAITALIMPNIYEIM